VEGGRIISKWKIGQDIRALIGLIWLRTDTNISCCERSNEYSGTLKYRKISWPDEEISAFQK